MYGATFQETAGVTKVVSGYTGGCKENSTCEEVCIHTTGHYEAVQVHFNPSVLNKIRNNCYEKYSKI